MCVKVRGDNLITLSSARKYGISDVNILEVEADPYVVLQLRSEPDKLLFLGFD